ncbi:MAG: ComF family protein [Ferruginibacter sp.]|nr:ComF family protein [Ferruginibacter sp.]
MRDVLHLLYPHHCVGCESDLLSEKQLLCAFCINELSHTEYAKFENNPVERIFLGRIHIKAAHSEFYFYKGKLIQRLIHQLKYSGNREIGFFLGELMGNTLLSSGRFSDIDAVIPLPMHKKKEFKRGYNQAKIVAEGVARAMQIPVIDDVVIRNRITETQTRKHRAERWENVEESFVVLHKEKIIGKHILLVDDVITTGATLEACAIAILSSPGTTLSIATLARADK